MTLIEIATLIGAIGACFAPIIKSTIKHFKMRSKCSMNEELNISSPNLP